MIVNTIRPTRTLPFPSWDIVEKSFQFALYFHQLNFIKEFSKIVILTGICEEEKNMAKENLSKECSAVISNYDLRFNL